MDPTTICFTFTMWIGSKCLQNHSQVFVGHVYTSDKACYGIERVRPTIDAKFEVIADDSSSTALVRR